VTLAFVNNNRDDGNGDSYTYTGLSIGAAATGRYIVVAVTLGSGTPGTTAVTINGNAMTSIVDASDATSVAAIFIYKLETGTTADFVVSGGTGWDRCSIAIYTAYKVEGTYTSASDNTPSTNVLSVSISIPAGAAVVAVEYGDSSNTATWSGVTENYDVRAERHHSGGALVYTNGATGQTISVTDDNTNNVLAVAIIR